MTGLQNSGVRPDRAINLGKHFYQESLSDESSLVLQLPYCGTGGSLGVSLFPSLIMAVASLADSLAG